MGLFDKLKKVGDLVETVNTTANTVSKGQSMTTASLFILCIPRWNWAICTDGSISRMRTAASNYYTKSSVIAVKGKTDIMDADDNVVAHLEKKPVSLHEKHFVTMADGRGFTLSMRSSTSSKTLQISKAWAGRSGQFHRPELQPAR